MVFPVELASTLSGASIGQLQYWRRPTKPILVSEHGNTPRALYSFRDIIALRTVVKLRTTTSLQAVRTAFRTLRDYDLTDHPSQYQLVSLGDSIALVTEDQAMDLVKQPGSYVLATMSDLFDGFTAKSGRKVVDLVHPRPNLEVSESRLGGWPTASNTRVPYDAVADLMATGEVDAHGVALFYPTVSVDAARDAQDFAREVEQIRAAA